MIYGACSKINVRFNHQIANDRNVECAFPRNLVLTYATFSAYFDMKKYHGDVYTKHIFDIDGKVKRSYKVCVSPGSLWQTKSEMPHGFHIKPSTKVNVTKHYH